MSLSEEGRYLPKAGISTENPDPEVQVSTEKPEPEVQVSTENPEPEVQVSIFAIPRASSLGESDGVAERPAKKKGSKGLPKGIIEHRSSKLQARLSYKGEGGKTKQKFIPGLFDDIPAAVAAQAAAYQVLSSAGPLAVWPNDGGTKPARNKRGEVRTSRSPGLHRVLSA